MFDPTKGAILWKLSKNFLEPQGREPRISGDAVTWMDGQLVGFDMETTDRFPETALPCSFAIVSFNGGNVIKSRYALIDPGIEIPEEVVKIHGITTEAARERGGTLEKSIIGIAGALLAASFAGTPIVGANIIYDLTLLDACLKRLPDGEGLVEMGFVGPVIDCLVLDRHVDRYRKGSRKLSDLCQTYGIVFDDAHNAASDAIAATRVAIEIAERYPEVGNADAQELYVLQSAWRRTWANEFSDYLVKQGKNPMDATEGDFPIKGMELKII